MKTRYENAPRKLDYKDKPEVSYENLKVYKTNETNRPTSLGVSKNAYHKTRSRELDNSSTASQSRHSDEYSYKIKLGEPSEKSLKNIRSEQKKTFHRTLLKIFLELLSNVEEFKSFKLQSTSYEPPAVSSSSNTSKIKNSNSTNNDTNINPVDIHEKKQRNLISYQPLSQDKEDYRSACENCKSVVSTTADDEGEAINETMSLQRRPLLESGYKLCYRTSLTLPTNTRKQRSYPNTTNREKWFSLMQQSSSEESD